MSNNGKLRQHLNVGGNAFKIATIAVENGGIVVIWNERRNKATSPQRQQGNPLLALRAGGWYRKVLNPSLRYPHRQVRA
jgi:hypothetical protein